MSLRNIILIDDSESTNQFNRILLTKHALGDNIFTFTDASEALDWLKNNPPCDKDLILLDIYMPDVSGFDFLRELNKLDLRLELKPFVAMLTQDFNVNDYVEAKDNLRADEYIRKPLEVEDVMDIIQENFE
jgi:DNA-binding response OmpR family regulator